MKLFVQAALDYRLSEPCDILLQVEAAAQPAQQVSQAVIDISNGGPVIRKPGHGGVGERIWLASADALSLRYHAVVDVTRTARDLSLLAAVPLNALPGSVIEYLMPSRYCPSDLFGTYVEAEFGALEGGARVQAMSDWVNRNFTYTAGASTTQTTALDSFIAREGICRDYAQVLVTLVRASGIPARVASVYALGVTPPDFHAVAQVFLAGDWHLIDPTGMARPDSMAIIGVGRDAADVSFLMAFGSAELIAQSIAVSAL